MQTGVIEELGFRVQGLGVIEVLYGLLFRPRGPFCL